MIIKKSSGAEEFINKESAEEKLKKTIKTMRRASEEQEACAKAKGLGLKYMDLNTVPIDADALKIIPLPEARAGRVAAIKKTGRKIYVAASDPGLPAAKNTLKRLAESGLEVSLFLVSQTSVERAWSSYDLSAVLEPGSDRLVLKEEDLSELDKGVSDLSLFAQRITEAPTSETINIILSGAVKTASSDIHLEPAEEFVRLRYRIDGVLVDMAHFPKKIYPHLTNRIKMLGRLKLNLSNVPQNGRFSVSVLSQDIDIRVAVLPGTFGEDIVMRLLYQNAAALDLAQIGLRPEGLEKIRHEISKPYGMILVTGPTGSGKTTTLYAFINRRNEPETKIITIEDPVEYKIAGVSQTQVKPEEGYTFATGLSAILRQDPDIVMVGEIRDADTASIAVQAASTGHLVFSTLHTNNAAGAIPRLVELGVRPALIAPSVNVVVAQRLVRRLCPFCRERYSPADETKEKIKDVISAVPQKSGVAIPKKIDFLWRAKGCPKCNFGYKGRVGVFEILLLSPKINRIISDMAEEAEIDKAAREEGMLTMKQDGILKALEGITTISEVEKAAGEL